MLFSLDLSKEISTQLRFCFRCDDGYYGNPLEIGSKCQRCPCHGGPCEPLTGQCITCL